MRYIFNNKGATTTIIIPESMSIVNLRPYEREAESNHEKRVVSGQESIPSFIV